MLRVVKQEPQIKEEPEEINDSRSPRRKENLQDRTSNAGSPKKSKVPTSSGKQDLLVKEKPHSLQTEEIALTEKTQRLPAVQVLPTVMTVQAHQIALIFQREKKTRVL